MLILLEQLAERGPVILIIEDAHWADRSTRDLLAFLIRNQHVLDGVLIAVTYRSTSCTVPIRCARCSPSSTASTGSPGSSWAG